VAGAGCVAASTLFFLTDNFVVGTAGGVQVIPLYFLVTFLLALQFE
jgi:hypothetical protein